MRFEPRASHCSGDKRMLEPLHYEGSNFVTPKMLTVSSSGIKQENIQGIFYPYPNYTVLQNWF